MTYEARLIIDKAIAVISFPYCDIRYFNLPWVLTHHI